MDHFTVFACTVAVKADKSKRLPQGGVGQLQLVAGIGNERIFLPYESRYPTRASGGLVEK